MTSREDVSLVEMTLEPIDALHVPRVPRPRAVDDSHETAGIDVGDLDRLLLHSWLPWYL